MKIKISLFLFNAWLIGLLSSTIFLWFGEPLWELVVKTMTAAIGIWYTEYPALYLIAFVIPLLVGIPIRLVVDFLSLVQSDISIKEDAKEAS